MKVPIRDGGGGEEEEEERRREDMEREEEGEEREGEEEREEANPIYSKTFKRKVLPTWRRGGKERERLVERRTRKRREKRVEEKEGGAVGEVGERWGVKKGRRWEGPRAVRMLVMRVVKRRSLVETSMNSSSCCWFKPESVSSLSQSPSSFFSFNFSNERTPPEGTKEGANFRNCLTKTSISVINCPKREKAKEGFPFPPPPPPPSPSSFTHSPLHIVSHRRKEEEIEERIEGEREGSRNHPNKISTVF